MDNVVSSDCYCSPDIPVNVALYFAFQVAPPWGDLETKSDIEISILIEM